jgi:chemotaxis response regulator CheB
MPKTIRILIADHHTIFVDEIKEVIEMAANLTVADQAANGAISSTTCCSSTCPCPVAALSNSCRRLKGSGHSCLFSS